MPKDCHYEQMGTTVRAARELIANTARDLPPGQLFGDAVMQSVNSAVGFDGYCLFAVDPITGLRCAMFSRYGLEASAAAAHSQRDGRERCEPYADLVRRPGHAGVLALRVSPEPRSPRLHEILRPQGYESELRLALVADGRYWGSMVLFRGGPLHPFTESDAEVATELADPLCAALRRHQVRRPEVLLSAGRLEW